MMPIGPLMVEHRFIERMIRVIKREIERIEKENRIGLDFIDTVVDFIRTYADRSHHGKEEDILFRDLNKKSLSDEHKKTINELIQEHIHGRNNVKSLVSARDRYARNDKTAIASIVEILKKLAEFYPKHIEKEDKRFFVPVMAYFSKEELDKMLKECREFDRQFDHKKYERLVEKLEGHVE